MAFFIYCFIPHMLTFFRFIKSMFIRLYDRKFGCNQKITRKYIQIDYNKVYLGPSFLIENSYSIVILPN